MVIYLSITQFRGKSGMVDSLLVVSVRESVKFKWLCAQVSEIDVSACASELDLCVGMCK